MLSLTTIKDGTSWLVFAIVSNRNNAFNPTLVLRAREAFKQAKNDAMLELARQKGCQVGQLKLTSPEEALLGKIITDRLPGVFIARGLLKQDGERITINPESYTLDEDGSAKATENICF